MYELNDLLLLLKSGQPLINIQTHEERRALSLVNRCGVKLQRRVLKWSVTSGLVRADNGKTELSLVDKNSERQPDNSSDPKQLLQDIRNTRVASIYVMLDFNHYFDDPYVVRMIKEIAQDYPLTNHHLVFISHELEIPSALKRFTSLFSLSLPDREALEKLIHSEAKVWKLKNENQKLSADRKSVELLVNNLTGLTVSEAQRLIRNAIYDDNALSSSDIERVQKAKYELLGQDGLLQFELETANFNQVGGLSRLKSWLELRRKVFLSQKDLATVDKPKGILLVGVQGGGKSLAAKAVAGAWGIPLLRFDFGVLYNKFFGETEKNIRQAIELAEVMSPCVLWIDEIEKAISTGDYDSGTSQRLLATLLTWMAENKKPVFIVATANKIADLPPELIRKGRLDEIFFVDLPAEKVRQQIFEIHCNKRDIDTKNLDMGLLANKTAGFSGAEIEQIVVSSFYRAHAVDSSVDTRAILAEIETTQPLSVVMEEGISDLRAWAKDRTVMAD